MFNIHGLDWGSIVINGIIILSGILALWKKHSMLNQRIQELTISFLKFTSPDSENGKSLSMGEIQVLIEKLKTLIDAIINDKRKKNEELILHLKTVAIALSESQNKMRDGISYTTETEKKILIMKLANLIDELNKEKDKL